jgi:hypothetical protein
LWVKCLLKLLDAINHRLQSSCFRRMHWTAPITRKSISVAVNDIDITGTLCDAFFKNPGALIGQRERQAIYNFASLILPLV